MATNKDLLEQLISDQKKQAQRQLDLALETSNRLNKLEIFIYGDNLTNTKGVVQDIRETKERLEKVESAYKITKTKVTTAFLVIGFVITGAWNLIKHTASFVKDLFN